MLRYRIATAACQRQPTTRADPVRRAEGELVRTVGAEVAFDEVRRGSGFGVSSRCGEFASPRHTNDTSQAHQSGYALVVDQDAVLLQLRVDPRETVRLTALIMDALTVLSPGGALYFSTNHQRFQADFDGLPVAAIEDMTSQTIPIDFKGKTPHRIFRMLAPKG